MIPLRATNVKNSDRWPNKIVLHHTSCKLPGIPSLQFDKPTFQTNVFQNTYYRLYKKESGYHFIVDRVGNDYQIIVNQPMLTISDFPDISLENQKSVHIALVGNYDNDIPPKRIFKVLGYRLLNPLMRLFLLDEKDIVFHSGISDEEKSCPGEFMDMSDVLMGLRSVRRKSTLKRG